MKTPSRTPVQAPKNNAGANTPPTNPILIQITVKINFATRNKNASCHDIDADSKFFIVSVPSPVASGINKATNDHIKAAVAG